MSWEGTSKLFVLSVFLALIIHIECQLDGGSDGTNGNQFFDGTANTDKLSVGVTCKQASATATGRLIEIYAYQSDEGFVYNTGSPDHLKGDYVDYTNCHLLNLAAFNSTGELVKPTVSAACGSSADFTFLDASGVAAAYETRVMTKSITISDPAAASYPCGASKAGTLISIAFQCKRDINFDKDFDYIFLVQHDFAAGLCLVEELTTEIEVGDPPVVDIVRNYDVTFKAYKALDITSLPDAHESPAANEITSTTSVPLGQEMYLEACLKIPSGAASNQQFFNDGVSPVGLTLYSCTAEPGSTGNQFTADSAALKPTIVDSDGCGMEADPVRYFSKNNRIFKWFRDSTDTVAPYLRSPNCFRSPPFEAVSFQRKTYDQKVKTLFKCSVLYCTSSSDNRCFGDLSGGSAGYPACQLVIGKKKREVITIGPDYPEEVSVLIDVILPGSNTTSSPFNGCFEKTAFISLTSVLTGLLLAVLAVAGYLMYKLRSPDFDDLPGSSSGSGSRTMTGSVNKAFF